MIGFRPLSGESGNPAVPPYPYRGSYESAWSLCRRPAVPDPGKRFRSAAVRREQRTGGGLNA